MKKRIKKSLKEVARSETIFAVEGEQTFASAPQSSSRRNAASTIEKTDRFKNIDDGLVPFKYGSAYGNSKCSVNVRDAVILCQKCYYNFAIFRNVIDLMTEFSVNNIFYRGGNVKSRDFFAAFWSKVNIWDLQDKYFREYYRSGNVFIYRNDVKVQPEDISKITQIYGDEKNELKVEELVIPARYTILNPADIQMLGTANFGFGSYFKILTDFELARLKDPKTDEDVEIFNSLDPKTQKQIKDGIKSVMVPLDPAKMTAVFYKKQDYEPFAVPMGFPVLEDISAKAEMKKIDMAIARTMQQIILLITNGAEPEKGGINPANLKAITDLFQNQSVGRVLVADYTTEAEWKVPAIADLLTPEKYTILDRDINIGLNNIFVGEEKFANQQQKVELFVARLEQGRKAFMNNFLIPEIKRIAKAVGLKNYPMPFFEDIELKDNTNYAKIYARLIEIGVLTPEEGLKAIETNTLPDVSLMEEEQRKYKTLRDAGLYEPLVGGAKDPAAATGRPSGSKAPKKITPIGASEVKFGIKKVKDNLILAQELEEEVSKYYKEKNNIKKINAAHKKVIEQVSHIIIANEEPDNWKTSLPEYCETPIDKNQDRIKEIYEIAAAHDIDPYLASILLASKIDESIV